MRHPFLIVAFFALGLAPAAGQTQLTTCPECTPLIELNNGPVSLVSCPDCGTALSDEPFQPLSCSDLGGTAEGTRCKLADGRSCALAKLEDCSAAITPEEGEDWGEDPSTSQDEPTVTDGGQ